ncbi:MAG TPA: HEAT repeat domain-containing protein [Candidatus Thiothrix moscowensis]|uniref:HEAT repeat domain-containing protein n=1 Tax=unclassified Thiothrix TaxID=2636184 RepID=UPI0025EBA17A|nr:MULTISPECIES: HEAT repeat domain-containing protein [unclassified Thiothrix]HRJ52619.1 HEAT repeat domain-containing protein [Candidatus Thiothrix moscowensis]HRJ92897.1 HEAT repeat domain-containing protein [Candidatus Thiothrix moscowensis]
MFNRKLYLESVLSQLSGKAGEDAYVSTLADVVQLGRGHKKAKDNNQDVKPRRESVEVLTGLRANADKHVLLLGKPGSGKSTALKRLLREDAEKCLLNPDLKIPVLLELRRLSANTSIESLLAKALSVRDYRVKPEDIADLLDKYPFLLLLDGLNELPSGSGLYDWRRDFSAVSMIFTSRKLGAESYLGIDTRLSMLPLTEEQTKDFIKNRLGNDLAFGMLQSLHGRVKELTDTPLLLDMLCDTYSTSENVAQNQGELFRQFTHDQYEKHKPKDTLTPRHNEFFDFRDEVLQEIAFYMMNAGGDGKGIWLQVKRTDIEKRLEKYFRDKGLSDAPSKVKQWLDDALNFYLLQRSADKDEVEFTHQLFQEYYAAEYLQNNFDNFTDEEFGSHYLNSLKWTETISLLISLFPDWSSIERLLRIALSIDLKLMATLSGKVKDQYQTMAFDFLLHCFNVDTHPGTVFLLGKNATTLAVGKLTDLLNNRNVKVRIAATNSLVDISDPSTLSFLIHSLKDESPEVRELAVLAVGNIGGDDIYHSLIELIHDDFPTVRSSIALALGMLDNTDVSDILISLLKDKSSEVRESAAISLGHLRCKKAVKPLLELLHGDELSSIESYLSALKDIGDISILQSIIDFLHEQGNDELTDSWLELLKGFADSYLEDINNLIEIFQSKDQDVPNGLANLISKTKDYRAVNFCLLLSSHENTKVRFWSVYILSQLADKRSTETLVGLLKNEDSEIRFWAAYGLGEIGDLAALKSLDVISNDKNLDVYQSYLFAAAKLKKPFIESNIIDAIVSTKKSDDRAQLIDLLGELGTDEAIDFLVKLIHGKSLADRIYAMHSLAQVKKSNVAGLLIDTLKYKNIEIQVTAINSLSNFRGSTVTKALIEKLNSKSIEVREASVHALWEIQDIDSMSALIEALNDASDEVRNIAINALGELKHPLAISALIKELARENKRAKDDLIYTLGATKEIDAIISLIKYFSDADINTKEIILEALGDIEIPCVIDFMICSLNDCNSKIYNTAALHLSTMTSEYAFKSSIEALSTADEEVVKQILFGFSKKINLKQLDEIGNKLPFRLSYFECAEETQGRCGYYSYEWFEKYKVISRYTPIKEVNMSGATINFNAPINQYGNGTLTGNVTNNHYGDKPQAEHHPLILTEGKTDWKHLEFALKKLQAQGKFSSLKIEFSKTEEHMGYAQMLQHCQALSKSPQNRLHICIFDRDEEKVNSEFKVKNNSDKAFAYYGNNVFITRIPQLIDVEDKISIENYYSNHDLERTDSQGRRLPRAGFKVINNQTPEDLSKNDFADNIRKETHEFKDVDVSNFAKIFELIETIIAEAKKPR